MLTNRQLIAHLEALALPDSPVFFLGREGGPVPIEGGIAKDHGGAPDGKIVVLSAISLDLTGGF